MRFSSEAYDKCFPRETETKVVVTEDEDQMVKETKDVEETVDDETKGTEKEIKEPEVKEEIEDEEKKGEE